MVRTSTRRRTPWARSMAMSASRERVECPMVRTRGAEGDGVGAMASAIPLRRAQILAGQRAPHEVDRLGHAVQGHEGAHARALALAEQHLVEPLDPVAQVGEAGALAALVPPGRDPPPPGPWGQALGGRKQLS